MTSGDSIEAQSFTGIFNGALSSSCSNFSDISGSFVSVSQSLSTRITAEEGEAEGSVVSSSAQLASDISGSLVLSSASFSTRVTNLKTDSGSFSTRITNLKTNSGSFSTRTTTLESRVGQSLNTSDTPTFGGLTVEGNITAETFVVSSSITNMTQSFSSGSTIFGDSPDDTHQFTSSILIGSGSVSGSHQSTGSFGTLRGDGSQLTGITTDVFSDGSANKISGSSVSTGSFSILQLDGATFTSASLAAGGSGGGGGDFNGNQSCI